MKFLLFNYKIYFHTMWNRINLEYDYPIMSGKLNKNGACCPKLYGYFVKKWSRELIVVQGYIDNYNNDNDNKWGLKKIKCIPILSLSCEYKKTIFKISSTQVQ